VRDCHWCDDRLPVQMLFVKQVIPNTKNPTSKSVDGCPAGVGQCSTASRSWMRYFGASGPARAAGLAGGLRRQPRHAPENVPVAPVSRPGAPGGDPKAFAQSGASRLREAAHKFYGMVSRFSTIAGDQAANLEDLAAKGQLDETTTRVVEELATSATELARLAGGHTIDTLRRLGPPDGPTTQTFSGTSDY